MRLRIVLTALVVASCHSKEPATGTGSATTTTPSAVQAAAPPAPAPAPAASDAGAAGSAVAATPPAPAPSAPSTPPPPPVPAGGHDFTSEAKALLAVGACGDGAVPDGITPEQLAAHCNEVKKAQSDYVENWVKPASEFFSQHVPKDIPKKVVYPFAGGDLSTALTVFPDADEITNISLEPAGDPRDIDTLRGADLERALKKVAYELKFLYRVNFSNTINMIDAMRGGALPTELIFALSALKIHGYQVVALRYFKINDDGSLHYLDDDDLAKAPKTSKAEARNWFFANAELQFRRDNGRIQIYRHIRQNLGNEESKGIGPGLKKDPRVLRYLEAKGPVAAMTKAASYLLSWESFSLMRDYLLKNAVWMVSDATGVAPKWGRPAGFEYETYGTFVGPHIPAGSGISKDWRTEFETEPHRDLAFRFGYYDVHNANHLIIMKKRST
jgi:hypothetical protein